MEQGLTGVEAKKRLDEYGPNTLAKKKRFTLVVEFISSFFSPLILLLLAAGLISAAFGDAKDFLIIIGIIVLSGTVTFVQHFRAEKAAEALKQRVQLTAAVIRDGEEKEIPFSEITMGDVVKLSAGDIVPADARFLNGRDLLVDESVLTGESFPVSKSLENANLFLGTHVVTGEAMVVVEKIGQNSQFGKLSKEILSSKPKTSFDKGMDSFSRLVVQAVLVLTIFVFFVNASLHHGVLNSLLFALSLAVGLTPELLPVILTINLSRGALRMEQKDVIVKYLPAIQNFGGMNILCTDKTGTLTENSISLHSFIDRNGKESTETLLAALLTSTFQSGYKNPLDSAVLVHSHNLSLDNYKKIDDIPFDFIRKALSVIVEDKKKKKTILITKGSPHKMIEKIDAPKKEKESIMKLYESLSLEGLRVIAVAQKFVKKKKTYSAKDEENLHFVGFLTFVDPVKHSAKETIRDLEASGIEIKILTGDNEFVTKTVCAQVGIVGKNIILGHEIDTMGSEALFEKVKTTTIFARLSPEQKKDIVTILKKQGNVVGFLGDGINDAPPLKASDVGISVSSGSDIAKETSDVILMKYSLHVLLQGVIEGRKTYANILKYIMMELSSNLGNMVTIAISSIFLPFLPLLPVQILLNNFLYDFSQLTLASDNVDMHFVKKPQKWDISFIKSFMLTFGPISSIFDFITFFILLSVMHATVSMFRTGWFIESLVTQTLIIFVIRTKSVPFFKSKPSRLVVISCVFVILLGILITQHQIGSTFAFVRLPLPFFIALAIIVLMYIVLVECIKIIYFRNKQ